jgi:hypothetical protein
MYPPAVSCNRRPTKFNILYSCVIENKETPGKKDNTVLIVLLVVGVVAILLTVALIITIYRIKRPGNHLRQKRVSDSPKLPDEILNVHHANDDHERYEMGEAWKLHNKKKPLEDEVMTVSAKENPGFDE